MNTFRGYFTAVFLLYCLAAVAQDTTNAQQIKLKPSLVFQFDNKGSFVDRQSVTIWGAKLGVELFPYRFGAGYYNLFKTVEVQLPARAGRPAAQLDLQFTYFSVFCDRIWLQNKHWEITNSANIGYSTIDISRNAPDNILKTDERNGFLGELSVNTHYKLLSWAAVECGAGYRMMFDPSSLIRRNFDAPIYTAKVKFFPSELLKSYKNKAIFNFKF